MIFLMHDIYLKQKINNNFNLMSFLRLPKKNYKLIIKVLIDNKKLCIKNIYFFEYFKL